MIISAYEIDTEQEPINIRKFSFQSPTLYILRSTISPIKPLTEGYTGMQPAKQEIPEPTRP